MAAKVGIHYQSTRQGWPQRSAGMPLIKWVGDYQKLQEVKQANPNALTIFRSWREDLYHWALTAGDPDYAAREYFRGFMDGTFWQGEFWRYIDVIEEFNEYTASSHTEQEKQVRIAWMEALCREWNILKAANPNQLGSGRTGGPIRLCMVNAPIGNDIDWRYAAIAAREGHYLGYHPYILMNGGVRDASDWRWHSGRWSFNDDEFRARGIRPNWLFTEGGPYFDVVAGWRDARVCGGDLEDYWFSAVEPWLRDVESTQAYNDGRVHGVVLFTASDDWTWRMYDLKENDISFLNDRIREYVSVPPLPPQPPREPEPATPSWIINYVNELETNLASPYPFPVRPLSQIDKVVIHHSAGNPNNPVESIHIGHVNNNWPRIGYHYYIRPDGRIYKANLLTDHTWHATTANASSVGICLAGDFSTYEPTEQQLSATRNLINWLSATLKPLQVTKHQDHQNTQCPGHTWPSWYPTIMEEQDLGLNHVVTVNLIPQEFTDEQYNYVRTATKAQRETILQSADDAVYLVNGGLPGSKVKVWNPQAWSASITDWLRARGVALIETFSVPAAGESAGFTFPSWDAGGEVKSDQDLAGRLD